MGSRLSSVICKGSIGVGEVVGASGRPRTRGGAESEGKCLDRQWALLLTGKLVVAVEIFDLTAWLHHTAAPHPHVCSPLSLLLG